MERENYISVTSGLRGYFAVLIGYSDDGYAEPIQTGFSSFTTYEEAEKDARVWAMAECVEFKGRK